jgi:integrase
MLLVSGVDARTTAGILGHASPIVTMSTYAHLLDEAQREGVERLGAAIERCTQRNRRQP